MKPIISADGPIKILGITITPSYKDLVDANFPPILKKVETIVQLWQSRSLTTIGKVLLVNTLMTSLVVYKLMCLPTPSTEFLEQFRKITTEFIWNNKPSRIACRKIIQQYEVGGLKLGDLKIRDTSFKTTWVRRLFDHDGEAFWPICL